MFTMTRELKEALREHFIHQKLEISYAILKPFPFLEGLRDKSFITEKTYSESLEACRNMVPLSKVVHNILTQLEDTFQPSLLEMLFSQINLREYPNLKNVLNSFRSVFIPCGAWPTQKFEAPAHPAVRNPHQTMLPLPAPLKHPIPVPKASEPRAVPQHSVKVLDQPSNLAGPAKDLPRVIQKGRVTPANISDKEDSQQVPSSPPATVQVSSGNKTPQKKKKEDSQEMPHVPSAHMPVMRNDCPQPSHLKEAQEASSPPPTKKAKKRKRDTRSTPRKKHPKKSLPGGTASPGPRIQEKLQVVDQATQRKDGSARNSQVATKAKRARTEYARTSEPEEEKRKQSTLSSPKTRPKTRLPKGTSSPGQRIQEKLQVVVDQAPQRKVYSTRNSQVMTRAQKARTECAQTSAPVEKKRGKDACASSTKSCQKKSSQKGKPKVETVDFQSPHLPVSCGSANGVLYREKMKGVPQKCIQNEKGVWLTPKEFEIEGKGAATKNWKRNVRCGGETLERLVKEGLVLYPPRISQGRERENVDECEVCCRGGQLLCCDTCLRAFHEDCHIPPAEAERSPWSCTFCRIEEPPGGRPCLRESEVLAKPMGPEEQLKCEFLLLKTYCHPQSAFFAKIPSNIQDYGEPFREAMWLDLVKKRLNENVYTVAWFLRDMRLIFHNHKTFYKASDFGQVGLDLETAFEKDLKEVLSLHEAKEKGSQASP